MSDSCSPRVILTPLLDLPAPLSTAVATTAKGPSSAFVGHFSPLQHQPADLRTSPTFPLHVVHHQPRIESADAIGCSTTRRHLRLALLHGHSRRLSLCCRCYGRRELLGPGDSEVEEDLSLVKEGEGVVEPGDRFAGGGEIEGEFDEGW